MNRISNSGLLLGILIALISVGASWWILVRGQVEFGAVAVTDSTGYGRLAFGYFMTIVGVILGSGYRNLKKRSEKGEETINGFLPFVKSVFLSIDFWLGVCGSPLVYALLIRATEGGSIAGLTAIALENGFFCTVIISELKPAAATPTLASNQKPESV